MERQVWKGFKSFIVYDMIKEDKEGYVTSFYLKPED